VARELADAAVTARHEADKREWQAYFAREDKKNEAHNVKSAACIAKLMERDPEYKWAKPDMAVFRAEVTKRIGHLKFDCAHQWHYHYEDDACPRTGRNCYATPGNAISRPEVFDSIHQCSFLGIGNYSRDGTWPTRERGVYKWADVHQILGDTPPPQWAQVGLLFLNAPPERLAELQRLFKE
jgi:hypothetical protein